MNRSRGFRGYRSLSSFTPQRRASERLRKYKKTGRYSGTSVLAGRKHKKTPFSFRRKLSRLHTRYDIPYHHTHNSTGGTHKPTVLPIRRKRSSAFTYHNTISTHTEGIHKTHNMYNTTQYTPYIHSQHNTKGIYKPHNIYIKRKGALTYHRTASTHISVLHRVPGSTSSGGWLAGSSRAGSGQGRHLPSLGPHGHAHGAGRHRAARGEAQRPSHRGLGALRGGVARDIEVARHGLDIIAA